MRLGVIFWHNRGEGGDLRCKRGVEVVGVTSSGFAADCLTTGRLRRFESGSPVTRRPRRP